MKLFSADLLVSELSTSNSDILPNMDSTAKTYPVRWNPSSMKLEYQSDSGTWWTVPEKQLHLSLPSELAELSRWAMENTKDFYHHPLLELINWISNTKKFFDQMNKDIDNPAVRDAWNTLNLSLEQFLMLQILTQKEKKDIL